MKIRYLLDVIDCFVAVMIRERACLTITDEEKKRSRTAIFITPEELSCFFFSNVKAEVRSGKVGEENFLIVIHLIGVW